MLLSCLRRRSLAVQAAMTDGPAYQMELYFSCEELVQMWVVKMFGQPKSLKSPTPYVLVKELDENGKWVEVRRCCAVRVEGGSRLGAVVP